MVIEFPTGVELALKFIREERCCPPIEVLSAGLTSDHARKHLESCDLCREKIGLGHDGGGLVRIFSEPEKSSVPTPGQVWTMRPERGGWGPGTRWYGTPDVLVLRTIGNHGVRVAQVCELEELLCNEDVPLGEGFAGFAESWNTFPLLVDDLDGCLGEVGAEVVEAVLAGERIAGRDNLPLFMADFRRMELDTSVYHARRAAFILAGGVEINEEDTENPVCLVFPQEFMSEQPDAERQATILKLFGPAVASGNYVFSRSDESYAAVAAGSDMTATLLEGMTITARFTTQPGEDGHTMVEFRFFGPPYHRAKVALLARETGTPVALENEVGEVCQVVAIDSGQLLRFKTDRQGLGSKDLILIATSSDIEG